MALGMTPGMPSVTLINRIYRSKFAIEKKTNEKKKTNGEKKEKRKKERERGRRLCL